MTASSTARLGEFVRQSIEGGGTTAALQTVAAEATGRCAVLVCNDDRALAGLPGAARSLSHEFVVANAPMVDGAAIVLIDGFALVSPKRVEMALWLARRAAAAGARLALNLQSANLLKFNKNARDAITEMLPLATYIFGNTAELAEYAAQRGWSAQADGDEMLSLAAQLAAQLATGSPGAPAAAVFTAGASPSVLASRDGRAEHVSFPQEASIPAGGDTNGCGDSFVGGFLAAAAMGKPLQECVSVGHSCAQNVLRHTGVPKDLGMMVLML